MSTIDRTVELAEIFRTEVNDRLDAIVSCLLAVEEGRGTDDALDVLFRHAHTIKGSAAMLGAEEVRDLAHAMEEVLAPGPRQRRPDHGAGRSAAARG